MTRKSPLPEKLAAKGYTPVHELNSANSAYFVVDDQGARYVLKSSVPVLLPEWEDRTGNLGRQVGIYKIIQEYNALRALDVPGVPKAVDIFTADDRLCLIREYVNGDAFSLRYLPDELKEGEIGRPDEPHNVLGIIAEAGDILADAHQQDVCHGNVSLDHILVYGTNRVGLIGWSNASVPTDDLGIELGLESGLSADGVGDDTVFAITDKDYAPFALGIAENLNLGCGLGNPGAMSQNARLGEVSPKTDAQAYARIVHGLLRSYNQRGFSITAPHLAADIVDLVTEGPCFLGSQRNTSVRDIVRGLRDAIGGRK